MLEYLGQKAQSEAIFNATKKVIAEKKKLTYDLGGNAKSSEMVDEIIRNIKAPLLSK
jgi:isocitrate dehydrogenase